ncbi:MAG: outer membrane beta-barrel protein [Flavobacteriaceae bacterium]
MKKLITLMSLAVVGLAFGQEEEQAPKFNVSGSVDAYYRANLTSVNDGANNALGVPGDLSAFANDSGFSLGLANVTLSYEGEKVGFVADLAYGPRADEWNGGVVNEAYVYWNVNEKVSLMMGRFNSWMGYERISPANNFHYSMSHMFTYSARNWNGLVGQFDLGNDFNFGVAVMNPTDVVTGNATGDYSIAAGVSKGNTGISFASSQETTYIDFKTAFDLSDNFNVAVNVHNADFEEGPTGATPGRTQAQLAALGIDGFTSISAYPRIKSSDNLSWGMRLEYMMMDDANDTTVFTPTLTANYSVGDLTIIPELRLDSASEDLFKDTDGADDGSLTSFTLAAVYSF